MKKSVLVILVLAIFSAVAYAQMGQMEHGQMQGDQQMKMDCPKMKMMQGDQQMKMDCPKMKMMQGDQQMKMDCPKMKMMQGDPKMKMMHCQDTMQMMISIMDMQEKIVMGVKPEEKEKMLQDIKQTKEKMQNVMSSCKCMMGGMMEEHAPAASTAPESTEKQEPAMTEPHHMMEPNKK